MPVADSKPGSEGDGNTTKAGSSWPEEPWGQRSDWSTEGRSTWDSKGKEPSNQQRASEWDWPESGQKGTEDGTQGGGWDENWNRGEGRGREWQSGWNDKNTSKQAWVSSSAAVASDRSEGEGKSNGTGCADEPWLALTTTETQGALVRHVCAVHVHRGPQKA
jgi:hypothetical protein